jgi:4-hydroxy-tetrahydrodipicolinate reductase
MQKGVLVYGVGKLGESIIKGLIDRGIKLFHESYNGPNDKEYIIDHKNVIVDVLNSKKLKNNIFHHNLKEQVSFVIVTLTGDILEKEIDFLLSLEIPLIILSTKFDEESISKKAKNAGVKILMSQNMALAIVDFWNRIEKIPKVPDTLDEIYLFVIESHQNSKADISGSAIKALNLFKQKDLFVMFDEQDKKAFVKGIDGEYGCIKCIREENTQLTYMNIPKEYLSGHGYHTFSIFPEVWNENTVKYLNLLYIEFKTLTEYSIEGIFEFNVNIIQDEGLVITHNINGRDIYTDGVVKSIEFLNKQKKGVYSAIDIINQ